MCLYIIGKHWGSFLSHCMRAFLTPEAGEHLHIIWHLCFGVCNTRWLKQCDSHWDLYRGMRWSTYPCASHFWHTKGSNCGDRYMMCLLQSVGGGLVSEHLVWIGVWITAAVHTQWKLALSHMIYFSSPKTQNSTQWAAVLYKLLKIACASQMGTTNTIKRI